MGIKLNKKRRIAKQEPKKVKLTVAQEKAKRAEYMHQYYMTHREKAAEYQKEYNRQHRQSLIAQRKREEYANKYAKTGKEFERDAVRTVHNANSLQAIPVGGKLVRELERILSGVCDYAGCR